MSVDQNQINKKLGKENVEIFLQAFIHREGSILPDKYKADSLLKIASAISDSLRSSVKQKLDDDGFQGEETGWYFLDCWYKQDAGINIMQLIAIIKSEDIQLPGLLAMNLINNCKTQIQQQLAPESVKIFLDACASGEITSDLLFEIASKISVSIRGALEGELSVKVLRGEARGWSFLMCWYNEDVSGMKIEQLIEALKSNSVQLFSLAHTLGSRTNTQQSNDNTMRKSLEDPTRLIEKIVVEEMIKICGRNPLLQYDEIFAKDLNVATEYALWVQSPRNWRKPTEEKIIYILEIWKNIEGETATAETMYKTLENLSDEKKIYQVLVERLLLEVFVL